MEVQVVNIEIPLSQVVISCCLESPRSLLLGTLAPSPEPPRSFPIQPQKN